MAETVQQGDNLWQQASSQSQDHRGRNAGQPQRQKVGGEAEQEVPKVCHDPKCPGVLRWSKATGSTWIRKYGCGKNCRNCHVGFRRAYDPTFYADLEASKRQKPRPRPRPILTRPNKIAKKKPRRNANSNAASVLKISYINSQSVNALTNLGDRRIQIGNFLQMYEPHFLFLAETWLNDLKSPPKFANYSLVARKDKASRTGIGGGTCIYRKMGLKTTSPKVVLKLPLSQVSSVKYRDLLIQVVYRSPKQKIEQDRQLYEYLMSTPEKNRLIVGDFNVAAAWTPNQPPTSQSDLIREAFEEMSLTQIMDEPTRGTNILDLIFLSNPDLLLNKQCIKGYIADHNVIVAEIKAPFPFKTVMKTIYVRKKLDEYQMKLDLSTKLATLPNSISDELECETYCRLLHQAIRSTTADHLEKVKKIIKVDASRPFENQETRKLLKLKRKLWNKFRATKSEVVLEQFHKIKKSLEIKVTKAQLEYEMDLAVNYQQKQRSFHRYISNSTKEESEVGPLMGSDGLVYEDGKMADLLVEHFANACTPVEHYNGGFTHPGGVEVMDDVIINDFTVLKASKMLKKNKCASWDGIRTEDLLIFMDVILRPFVKLFYFCYNKSFCPTYWMTALGLALLKPDKPRELAKSYRIISVQPITFKWMELVVFRPWLDFVQGRRLLPACQHGATKGKSTITNLVDMISYITSQYEGQTPVAFISIDQTAAFDRLSYSTIVESVLKFGMSTKAARLLNSLFQGRKLAIRVGQETSKPREIVSGVCQGALASPGIYTAAFSSILEKITSNTYVFMDDLVLVRPLRSEDDVTALQADLNWISEWCHKTKAEVSEHKSSQVIFSGKDWPLSDSTFEINGSIIPTTDLQKHLGFFISEDLTTSQNFRKTVSKLAQKTYLVKRSFKARSKKFLTLIWSSYLSPIVEYPSVLYDLRENLVIQQKLCKIQRWFFRDVVFEKDEGPNCILRKMKYLKLMFMYRLYHGKLGIPREKLLTLATSQTRKAKDGGLLMPKVRTKAGLRSFSASIVQPWEEIPAHIRNQKSERTFSVFLKTKHAPTRFSAERVAAVRYSWAEQVS